MARSLDGIKDGGRSVKVGTGGQSVKVGTTGTISSLMTRELESVKSANQTAVSSRTKPRTAAVSVHCGATTPKRSQPRKPSNEASSSGTKCKTPDVMRKMKSFDRRPQRIPMLGSENIAFDRTPSRYESDRKGPNIVEMVDIKCGSMDRKAWASPISCRLKKLGFAKLSQSII